MTEVVVGVSTYALRKLCDVCGKGSMCALTTHATIATHPLRYAHTCDACGATANYEVRYPEIRHEIGTIEQPVPFVPVWGQRSAAD